MIKCPNCDESTDISIIDTEVCVEQDTIFVYITYRCKCRRGFVTRSQMNREISEKVYIEEI